MNRRSMMLPGGASFLLAGLTLISTEIMAHAHGLDVARDANNKLILEIEVPKPFPLLPSPFPEFDGYADAQPGFQSIINDEEPLFALPGTSEIEFSLLAADTYMIVWNDTGSAPMRIGESFYMGFPFFMVHPVWQITPEGSVGQTYTLTIQLHDRSGQLSDSDPIELPFTPVPEPASALTLLVGLAMIARRRV